MYVVMVVVLMLMPETLDTCSSRKVKTLYSNFHVCVRGCLIELMSDCDCKVAPVP